MATPFSLTETDKKPEPFGETMHASNTFRSPRAARGMDSSGTKASNEDHFSSDPRKEVSFQGGATPTPRKSSRRSSVKDRKKTPFKQASTNILFTRNQSTKSGGVTTNNAAVDGPFSSTFSASTGAAATASDQGSNEPKNAARGTFTFGGTHVTPLKFPAASSNPFLKQANSAASTVGVSKSVAQGQKSAAPARNLKKPPPIDTGFANQRDAASETIGSTSTAKKFQKPPPIVEGQNTAAKVPATSTSGRNEPKRPPPIDTNAGCSGGEIADAKVAAKKDSNVPNRHPVVTVVPKSEESVATSCTIAEVEASLLTRNLLSYKDHCVEEIIDMFRDELHVDAISFCEEAKRLYEYEVSIIRTELGILRLSAAVEKTMTNQADAFNTLSSIGHYQLELESNLKSLEDQVEQVFVAHSSQQPTESDFDREVVYNMTNETMAHLEDLEKAMKHVYASTAPLLDLLDHNDESESQHIGRILQALHSNEEKLAGLELRGLLLSSDVAQVEHAFKSA